jgi:hypothetical protein
MQRPRVACGLAMGLVPGVARRHARLAMLERLGALTHVAIGRWRHLAVARNARRWMQGTTDALGQTAPDIPSVALRRARPAVS